MGLMVFHTSLFTPTLKVAHFESQFLFNLMEFAHFFHGLNSLLIRSIKTQMDPPQMVLGAHLNFGTKMPKNLMENP